MPNKFKATAELACWKEHVCVGCDSTFRYRLTKSRDGEGPTPEMADAEARRAAATALQIAVESTPCPTCGMFQPDMVGDADAVGHGCLTFLLLLGLGGLIGLAVPVAIGFFPSPWLYPVLTWLTVLLCGVGTYFHLRSVNVNGDLAANRKKAEEAIAKKTLRLEKPGRVEEPLPNSIPEKFGIGHWIARVVLVGGLIVIPAAEIVRLAAGWPWHWGTDPIVAGPGDDVRIYLPDEITSVKGHWKAHGSVEVLNAAELGLANPQVPAFGRDDSWGQFIFGKGSNATKSRVWIGVILPSDADLDGKTLQLHSTLVVTYPASGGLFAFQNEVQTFEHTTELRLAPPRAGGLYRALWWGGEVLGGVLVLLAGCLLTFLAVRKKRQAIPPRMFPIGEDDVPEVLPAE